LLCAPPFREVSPYRQVLCLPEELSSCSSIYSYTEKNIF
jgi:hypothetical protein